MSNKDNKQEVTDINNSTINQAGRDIIIKNDSQASTKILDTFCRGLDMTLESLNAFLNSKTEAKKFLSMEKAKVDAEVYRRKKLDPYKELLNERIIAREARRQQNISDIARTAYNELKSESSISSTPVDDIWAIRFVNDAEDISDESLKVIWGKILAGEIKSPGSYSLRALQTLKNLSKEEALLFAKACRMAIGYGEYFIVGNRHETNTGLGLSFDEANLLMEAGLLCPTFDAMDQFTCEDGFFSLVYQEYVIKITCPGHDKATAGVLMFTIAANQLYNIVEKTFDMPYILRVAGYFKKFGATKVEYGKYSKITDEGNVNYNDNNLIELQ